MGIYKNQFEILLLKNFKIISRKRMIWLLNVILPIVISSLLLVARRYIKVEHTREVPEYDLLQTNNFWQIKTEAWNLGIKVNWTLFYYPQSEELAKLMRRVAYEINPEADEIDVIGLKTQGELATHMFRYSKKVFGYIIFRDWDHEAKIMPRELSYEIRLNGRPRFSDLTRDVSWATGSPGYTYMMSSIRNPNAADGGTMYYSEGFILIQSALTRAFCVLHDEASIPDVKLRRFPIPMTINDQLKVYIPVLIVIYSVAFALPTIGMTQLMARERKKQLRQIMQIMGIPSWMHYSAWFTTFFVFQVFVCTVIVIIHRFSGLSIFLFTDHTILWLLLVCFATSSIFLAFFISTVTVEPVLGAQLPLYMVIMGSVVMALVSYYLPKNRAIKVFFSLLFNSNAFGYAFEVLFEFEYEEQGANMHKFFLIEDDTNVSIALMILIMLLSSLIYLLLTLYLEEVLPGDYGIPKKWYFFLTWNFWFGRRFKIDFDGDYEGFYDESVPIESPPQEKEVGIRVRRLTKIYEHSKKKIAAVDNLSVNFYQGEITVLLGENGAGKTTLIMMLVGMVPSTSGTVMVDNYEIRKQTKDIQKMIGICPQHNVLFEDLTVGEHIILFSRLKGKTMLQARREMERYIAGLQLEEKINSRVSTLSGGMKRKLCTGIAFAGGSPLVLFDEPTAGLDPRARRAIWDLMQIEKGERTIILSTHHMDEADLMGDRIAILNQGDLVCYGSPHFLKQTYPSGYRLILEKDPTANIDNISLLIKDHLKGTSIDMNIGSEMSYVLPTEEISNFPKLLRAVENNAGDLGITGYGITSTTMEQVFLKANGVELHKLPELLEKDRLTLKKKGFGASPNAASLSNPVLRKNQVSAMFVKYGLYYLRHYYVTATNLLTPVIFLLMTLTSVSIIKDRVMDRPLLMSLTKVDLSTLTVIYSEIPERPFTYSFAELVNRLNPYHEASFIDQEMGAFLFRFSKKNLFFYTRHMPLGLSLDYNDSATIWFNGQYLHSMPIGLQLAYDTYLKDRNLKLFVYNNPIPVPANEAFTSQHAIVAIASTPFAFGLLVTLLYGSLIDKYIIEKKNGFKFLQKMNGVSSLAYWMPGITLDYCIMMLSMCSCVLMLVFFHEPGMSSSTEMPRVLLLLFSFTFSLFPFMGIASLMTTSHMAFQAINLFFGSLLGLVLAIFIFFHRIQTETAFEREQYESLERWLHFHPYFNFFTYLGKMMLIYYTNNVCNYSCEMHPDCTGADFMCDHSPMCCEVDYHSMKPYSTGMNLVGFIWSGFLYFVFFFLYESGLMTLVCGPVLIGLITRQPPESSKKPLDSDVVEEKIRVNRMVMRVLRSHVLVIRNLTKYYKNILAVDDLCLAVQNGECLGVMGVNGAGKTTVFKMLIGEIKRSSGQAWIVSRALNDNWQRIYRTIGYCPQQDGLPPNMSVREILRLFYMLRGIPQGQVASGCILMSISFGFYEHIDKRITNLSGGVRRKVCAAIALIGDAQLLLLDEPSTGMDPLARRSLWDALTRVRKAGRSVVFTSHNMEECESLCTRSTIMVNGILQCIGSVQYLKTKFSKGFTAVLQMQMDQMTLVILRNMKLFIRNHFERVSLQEDYGGRLLYEIYEQTKTWAEIFEVMEVLKKNFPIENYTLSQTTLEQVFLSFAEHQREK